MNSWSTTPGKKLQGGSEVGQSTERECDGESQRREPLTEVAGGAPDGGDSDCDPTQEL